VVVRKLPAGRNEPHTKRDGHALTGTSMEDPLRRGLNSRSEPTSFQPLSLLHFFSQHCPVSVHPVFNGEACSDKERGGHFERIATMDIHIT
jgi:hypothetical protein